MTHNSIGYAELADALQNGLPVAQVRNRAGKFTTPTVSSTSAAAAGAVPTLKKEIRALIVNSPNAGAYPIAGFTYLLVYKDIKDPVKARALTKFLFWTMTDGQMMAPRLRYAPLPPSVVSLNLSSLGTLTTGGRPLGALE